jgi:hypothetical protein
MSVERGRSPSPLWLLAPAVVAPLLLAVPSPFWRAAAGFIAVTLLPGSLLVGLLDTYRPLGRRLRAALIIPAGLALTIVLLLALDYCGRYSSRRAAALLTLIEEGLALGWLWRGRACRPISWGVRVPRGGGGIVLVVAVLVFFGSVAYAASARRSVAPLTEFYLLGPDGRLPLSLGGDGVRVVVANHKGSQTRYRIVVGGLADGQEIPLGTMKVRLPAGALWEQEWKLPAGLPVEAVAFSLLKDDDPLPYRRLRIAVQQALVDQLQEPGGRDGEEEQRRRDDGDPQRAVQPRRPRGPGRRHHLADGE